MKKPSQPLIQANLAKLRQQRGLSAIALADAAGVTRQTIYAIETGSFVPNTAVALRLARALDTTVEDLFALAGDCPEVPLRTEQATLLPGDETADNAEPGQPVQLCRVDGRLIACQPSPAPWYFPPADAVISDKPARHGRPRVRVFQDDGDSGTRILVAGCDPGIAVLSRYLRGSGVELILAHRNSTQSLDLLGRRVIHVAGTHLRDDASGESNLPEIGRRFSGNSIAVISFAIWEQGIVTARGNPKAIAAIEDFARRDIRIVNRESGAGSRALLDAGLKDAGIASTRVRGYDTVAYGHLPVAWQVKAASVDACLATRAAARMFGLHFIPLVAERYDLAIRREHLELPGIQRLLDTLNRADFRRELDGLGGYDMRVAGQRVL